MYAGLFCNFLCLWVARNLPRSFEIFNDYLDRNGYAKHMIRSIKYDSIRKIIVLCCNFLPFSSFFIETYFKQCKRNECIMFLQKRRKKKRLRENTIIGRNYDLECNVTQHRDLGPFLFCALFPCALFVLRPFCCALFVAPLLSAPFFPRPNVVDC